MSKEISGARGESKENKEMSETGGGVVHASGAEGAETAGLAAHRGARAVAASPRLAVRGRRRNENVRDIVVVLSATVTCPGLETIL